jgi:type IV pilus assembly protein PilN
MIRVNLLPKDERAHQGGGGGPKIDFKVGEWVLPITILAAVGAIITGTVVAQRVAMASITKSIADVDAQSRALAPQIERVNRLAQEKAELDLRLGVISKLEEGRTEGVRMLDELAKCVPDHLWLTNMDQDGSSSLTLEGQTFSNLVVSDFMSRLERSPMFANVNLEVAERGEIDSRGVVKFRLTCQVTPHESAN